MFSVWPGYFGVEKSAIASMCVSRSNDRLDVSLLLCEDDFANFKLARHIGTRISAGIIDSSYNDRAHSV